MKKKLPPPIYRMVFNSISTEVLDLYKNRKMTRQEALSKLNGLVDYVLKEKEEDKNG